MVTEVTRAGPIMTTTLLHDKKAGLPTAIALGDLLRDAWDAGDELVLDLGEPTEADLSLVQTIEAARIRAEAEGRAIRLARPVSGAIAEVLHQSGLLWDAEAADLQFWFHQGDSK